MPDLSEIGVRGLVIAEDDEFFFVTENEWRQTTALSAPPTANGQQVPQQLVGLNVAVAKLSATAFVNLDALTNLDQSELQQSPPVAGRAPGPNDLNNAGVLLYENNKYYLVTRDKWHPLTPNAEGDAGVLVKRGAVVASVPANDIPTGTFCVLVNWNGLF